jgi:hypothetical protein
MIGGAVAFFSLQTLAAGCNLTITQLGHGYPAFGTEPAAPLITTALWDLTNVLVTLGYLPYVIAMFAVAAANRADPILPRVLMGPIAVLIAGVVGIVLIATLYIDTGGFTPMSKSADVLSMPLNLWLAVVAIVVLWRTRSARSQQ